MDVERWVKILRDNIHVGEDLQDALKEDGDTKSLIETGGTKRTKKRKKKIFMNEYEVVISTCLKPVGM